MLISSWYFYHIRLDSLGQCRGFLALLIHPALHMSDWTGVYGRPKFGCDTYKSLTVGVFVRHVSVVQVNIDLGMS